MGKIILTMALVLLLSVARGQQQLSYSYDASGNRTARTVSVGGQGLSAVGTRTDSLLYARSPKGKAHAEGKRWYARTRKKPHQTTSGQSPYAR